MSRNTHEYAKYYQDNQQVKIGIKLADDKYLQVGGVVRSIEEDLLILELVGTASAEESAVEPGSDIVLSTWTGWSLLHCSGLLTQKIYHRRAFIRLAGPVIERQSREYFRMDVSLPICYTIPERQLLPDVHKEWASTRGVMLKLPGPVLQSCPDGYKVAGWNDSGDIEPQRVNLSGGGLRFLTPVYVKPETLVTIDLFLPFIPPRVIHTVVETLRCSEIMLDTGRGVRYLTAMRFHFINAKDRESIIAFIFAEQRRILSSRVCNCL